MVGREIYYTKEEFERDNKEKPDNNNRLGINIEDQFNALTVIGYSEKRGHIHRWFCRCTCGNIITRDSSGLLRGKSKFCEGCSVEKRPPPPNKLNTKEFIRRSKDNYGSKFSYTKTIYTDSKTKLIVTCPEHGDVSVQPTEHVKGVYGCIRCAEDANGRRCTSSQEEYIEGVVAAHGAKYDLSAINYVNSNTMVTVTCTTHGNFTIRASNFKRGIGCSKCGKLSAAEKISGFYNKTIIDRHKDKYIQESNNVYVMSLGEDIFKIGIAKDIPARIACIKNASGLIGKCIKSFSSTTYESYFIENYLHKNNKTNRHKSDISWKGHTELFKFSEEELTVVLSYLDILIKGRDNE